MPNEDEVEPRKTREVPQVVRFADLNIPPPAEELRTVDDPEGDLQGYAVLAVATHEHEKMKRAVRVYLHAWIDLQQTPPVLKDFAIHGEQHPEIYDNGVWAEVLSAEGPDYKSAVKQLRKDAIKLSPNLAALRWG